MTGIDIHCQRKDLFLDKNAKLLFSDRVLMDFSICVSIRVSRTQEEEDQRHRIGQIAKNCLR